MYDCADFQLLTSKMSLIILNQLNQLRAGGSLLHQLIDQLLNDLLWTEKNFFFNLIITVELLLTCNIEHYIWKKIFLVTVFALFAEIRRFLLEDLRKRRPWNNCSQVYIGNSIFLNFSWSLFSMANIRKC